MKILGVSCFYHDAAAAIIVDGKIIAAAEEERFSRIKHDSGFPKKSIEFCLESAGVKSKDINWVVFYEKPFTKFERIAQTFLATVPKARKSFSNAYRVWLKDKLWIKSKLAAYLNISPGKILFVKHHLSHAAAAFYTSPYKEAAVLTCDGVGEWTTTALGHAENERVYLDSELKFPHSLGLFYSAFTQYLGFQINEGEFKVMGLAPYGKPIYKDKIEKMILQSTDGSFKLDMSYFNFHHSDEISFSQKFIDLFGVPPVDPKQSDEVKEVYADIAASAQSVLDDKVLTIAKHLRKISKSDNLVYAGGVALNGVTNRIILKESGFKNLYIHPAAGDSGGALGAALYVYYHMLGNKRKGRIFLSPYLGQEHSEKDIKGFLDAEKIRYEKFDDKKLLRKVSAMLVEGRVVGWVRGRFEWGPRALGSRSVLADPRSKKMKDLVNAKIKFREAFRPFAPVTLFEKAQDYYDIDKSDAGQEPLHYMIMVVPVRKDKRKSLGAITHVDGTARPQFIKREANYMYYDIVREFGKKTGVYTLLNTSFNLKGEPIVNTPKEAYDTFMRSGIDALVLNNFLIVKNGKK